MNIGNFGDGIRFTSTTNSVIQGNFVHDNSLGIRFVSSSSNIIQDNEVSNNLVHGIGLQTSTNNDILRNLIENNVLDGLKLIIASDGNNISDNDSNLNGDTGIDINSSSL